MRPALEDKQLIEQAQQASSAVREPLPGWASFTTSQKRLLAYLPIHSVKADAARQIGKSSRWLQNQEMHHPQFRKAVQAVYSREWNSMKVALALALDSVGPSMVALMDSFSLHQWLIKSPYPIVAN